MSRPPVTAGRGDLDQHAQRIMRGLRDKDAERAPERPQGTDTLYYRRTTVVQEDGSYEWHVEVVRGMAERVPPFHVRVRAHDATDRAIARRYCTLLEQHAYPNEEARRRAGECKLELLSEAAESLIASGKVTG